MKTETVSDTIIDLLKKSKVITTEQVATELMVKRAIAAGILAQLRKTNIIVGREGVWALNHTNLNQSQSILNTEKTTHTDLIKIMNSIVALGRKS